MGNTVRREAKGKRQKGRGGRGKRLEELQLGVAVEGSDKSIKFLFCPEWKRGIKAVCK